MTLRLTLYGDIDPQPRKAWLVSGLLGEGELSAIFGPPSCGKSVLAGSLAAFVARGAIWLGREVSPGAVLYIAVERAALVKRRLAAIRKYHDWPDLPLGVLQGAIDLRNWSSVDEITATAKELADIYRQPLRLIVIDTVSRALAGGDENSPKEMGALVNGAASLQEATGAHVCLIHHVPQDGSQRLRGHGALLGAVDTTLSVEKAATGVRTATVDKANDSEEGERLAFSLESVEIADDSTTAPVVIPADMPAAPAKPGRKLPDRAKAALDVLKDICVDGKPLPNGGGLPGSIRAVPVDAWRQALGDRGIIGADDANPRKTWDRIKTGLLARQLVAEREGQTWAV